MKRKKLSTKPPAKEKETPAKKENPVSENLGTHQLSEGEISEIVDKLPNLHTLWERIESDKVISGLIGDINFKSITFEDFAKNFDDPKVKQLEKALLKERLEKQTYKDALAEKEYQAFQKERSKARNGLDSSTHQILELMVVEYKKAVLESVDKKRIYKKVFWGLKRFKNFKREMYKEFNKSMFPKERSMEGWIRIAETELYYETKNVEFKLTDGRFKNEFKNYIPKYPDDIPPEPPKPSEPPKPKIDLHAMDEEFLKDD